MIPGSIQTSLQGFRVFIPNPLPPSITYSRSLLSAIEEATHLLGQVEMCRSLLPNPELFIYTSLQREAMASSTIEGTITTPAQLLLFQASHETNDDNTREVANYAEALQWGVAQLTDLPISTRLILGLHERLMHGVRGQYGAGKYKQFQNHIGSPNTTIAEATYVPPPPERIPELISALERYINENNSEPRLVQCALVHYQFETIHPFPDGNGRVGRLLIILQLIQMGLLSAPLIHPSVYFERSRSEYYQCLHGVHEKGAWEAWIEYFINGIIQQCRETRAFTRTMLDLQESLWHRLAANELEIRRHSSTKAVLDLFFKSPALFARQICDTTGLTYNTVKSVITFLTEKGIIREITGNQRNRIYVCLPLARAIFAPVSKENV